uniref:Uncharacterized protein n=1 Tax=Setaria italica TaxID=4555 RepID=K3ZY58_SETIT
MSSVLGGGLSPAAVIMRGREAILQALGSVSPGSSSSPAAAQGERGDDVRAGAAPPRRHAPEEEDGASPQDAASGSKQQGMKDTGTGDGDAGAVAAGSSPPGRLSAETAVAILVDCFGHC